MSSGAMAQCFAEVHRINEQRQATQLGPDTGLAIFHITIVRPDDTAESYCGCFADATEAGKDGVRRGGAGAAIKVRPEVETTYMHGKARYPDWLHQDATAEAWNGWVTAKNEAMERE